jgi:general stress protein YciG
VLAGLEDGRSTSDQMIQVSDQSPADCCGGGTVERDRLKVGEAGEKGGERIMPGAAYCLVEAALPICVGDHVPQPDALVGQPFEAVGIVERLQVLADDRADQLPESIARVGVIAPGGE